MTDIICPFCDSKNIRFDRHLGAGRGRLHDGQDVWSTCCYECGATFPNMYSREALEAKWRRRPSTYHLATLDAAIEMVRGEQSESTEEDIGEYLEGFGDGYNRCVVNILAALEALKGAG